MKFAEIIKRVRNISGDITAMQFTDAQVLDWINDGIRECAVQNNLLQKRATQPSVANQADYDLPTDILKLHTVKFDNAKLPVITLEEFDERYTGGTPAQTGTPHTCYVWAGKLTLYPTPDRIGTVSIDYLYDPPIETDVNNEVGLPVGYHVRLVDYCLAQVAQQDDDMNRYQLKMQQFETGVTNLKDQPENTYDLYPSMSVDARDMGNGADWDFGW